MDNASGTNMSVQFILIEYNYLFVKYSSDSNASNLS